MWSKDKKIVFDALRYQLSGSRTESSTSASGFAADSSGQNAPPGQSTIAVAGEHRGPVDGTAFDRVHPRGDLGWVAEDLQHVVTGRIQQLLERDLQRMGTGAAYAGADNNEFHSWLQWDEAFGSLTA
jgi:hypothetical protein